MKLQDALKHPEYLFRPSQIIARLNRKFSKPHERETVRLPWGASIKIEPGEDMGLSIWNTGVYDLTVTEALWRLTDANEVAVDVGANIGYMTSVMAKRCGPGGRILSFEPNPDVFKTLIENIECWKQELGLSIEAHNLALSNDNGAGLLGILNEYKHTHVQALLVEEGDDVVSSYQVELKRLDDLLNDRIDVLKIDVEGHELKVLQGAERLIDEHHIRDIIFEEHNSYPTPVTTLLENKGYVIFNLGQTLFGLKTNSANEPPLQRGWEPRSCLATINPVRALARLQKKGWATLRGSQR